MSIEIAGVGHISGLWRSLSQPTAFVALAHRASAGMTHRDMVANADGLKGLGVATLRYQFPHIGLGALEIPMLVLRGSKDALDELDLLKATVARLAVRATLNFIADEDHAFRLPAKTARKDPEVIGVALATMAASLHAASDQSALKSRIWHPYTIHVDGKW